MTPSKGELSELLRFRPGIIADPVPWPWLLEHLNKNQLIQVAKIQLDFQRTILDAYGKALQQYDEFLQNFGERG